MSDKSSNPTHYRLITALKAVGPYLREPLSNEKNYHFDCLSVCVDDKQSPEDREFWGWWLDLSFNGKSFEARYHLGLYNQVGEWVNENVPASAIQEINRTQEAFHNKLVNMLDEKFSLSVSIHEESVEFV
ncbi:sigma factor-binding protein Crl [Vibrio sp. ZSDZ34]|jgi:sigma factor-binding protein Crl|uniref:Sigma factor-binding protein Crl n=1 Tax=Vibrio gelatinilyticus TaxID=2893468 RepID=A0A9X1WC36_9VIBR|nr:sigma factor-binding protein Crl [Vibrio gelatinilyticus]MCJ2377823.1 sigma factor-binding protein Crl [Vibrio gelatinilyticus]